MPYTMFLAVKHVIYLIIEYIQNWWLQNNDIIFDNTIKINFYSIIYLSTFIYFIFFLYIVSNFLHPPKRPLAAHTLKTTATDYAINGWPWVSSPRLK